MISAVLRDYLATQFGLVSGKDIFAETGQGEKYVLVKDSYPRPWTGMPSEFRTSHIQITVKGYDVEEGYLLSQRIVNALKPLHGTFTLGNETFIVRSVKSVGLPLLATYKTFRAYSTNFSVSYIYDLTE